MNKNKYKYQICYSTNRKTIELAKTLNIEEQKTEILKSEVLNPGHIAWVLIHWLKGNNLKEIKTKFGTLQLREDLKNE